MLTARTSLDVARSPSRAGADSGAIARRFVLTASCLTGAAGLALFVAPLRGVTLTSMSGLGLISVLPVASLIGLTLLILAFTAMLARGRPQLAVLAGLLLAVIFCLDGVTAIAEPLPRFATTYQIAGFVGYISHTGQVAPGAAAYFSWPGFFALVSFAAGAAAAHSLLPLLTWWPLVINALCVLPFMMITRSLGMGWRARWFAALLFCVGNWVGQDYFSPQSFNYLLYLVFVAILLTWFGGRPATRPATRRTVAARPGPVSGTQRTILLMVLLGIFVTSTVSHQLTPFLMLATCAGLVIVGRCSLRGLPVLLAVILIGWISFGTVAYWSGHLSTIFGHIGQVGGNLSSSVGDRLVGTPVHQMVLYTRVGLPVAMAALAILGLMRRWRIRADNRALLVLLCVPVTAAALQNYGGEISLRIYLFALPAAAIGAACLLFPAVRAGDHARARILPDREAGQRSRAGSASGLAVIAAGLIGVILANLFLVARYGNEAFEQAPAGELAAMNYIYAHDHGGASVLWLSQPVNVNATPEMPWQYRDITSVQFIARQASRHPGDVAGAVRALSELGRGGYLITTATEAAYLRQTGSYPADWAQRFRAAMAADPKVRVVVANRTAAVYTARSPARTVRFRAAVSVGGVAAGATIWTPVGLAVLALTLLVLAARTFIAECVPARRRLLRPLGLASLPLLALLCIVVVERFAVLS